MNKDTKTYAELSVTQLSERGAAIPAPGATLGGRFVLSEELGHGASGTVFSALDTSVGQKVAIKILHPDIRDPRTRERLRREVRASRPGHPNAVTVYDLHETDNHIYLSLELVEGPSLRDLLTEKQRLEVEEVITIGQQIAAALKHLHDRGVIHRDVKPGNILVAPNTTSNIKTGTSSGTTAKLCDMGLARPLVEGVTVTETEMVVGTPVYMAPEQAVGELIAASDVYALGLTLYRCLSGKVPLTESSALATLNRRQSSCPPSIRRFRPECPRWLDRLLLRMLEPKPKDRPSAHDVGMVLSRRRLFPRPRPKVVKTALGAFCIVALASTAAYIGLQRETDTVDIGRQEIIGRDKNGRITWQREFDLPIAEHLESDLNGDGSNEISLVLRQVDTSLSRQSNEPGPDIWIFDKNGHMVTHFEPELEVMWHFPYNIELVGRLRSFDIDHNGTNELILLCDHRTFYPTVVFVFWAERQLWEQVMIHPGRIDLIVARPDGSTSGLRIGARNNLLGVLTFIGEIEITPPGERFHSARRNPLNSPPLIPFKGEPPFTWLRYVPIAETRQGLLRAIEDRRDGVTVVTSTGTRFDFDQWWNPIGVENAGRDLVEQRLEFALNLANFEFMTQPPSPDAIRRSRHSTELKFTELLKEGPYRVIFDIASARATARTGDLDAAISILRQSIQDNENHDLFYRLANFEAIAGNLDRSRDILDELISSSRGGTRSRFDAPHLLLRVAFADKNNDDIKLALRRLGTLQPGDSQSRMLAVLHAHARLWWDQNQPQDFSVTSWGYAPAGDAIACLARWRAGRSTIDDISAMNKAVQLNPDAEIEALLARSAVQISLGQPGESLEALSLLMTRLEAAGRLDYASYQLLDLALALQVLALEGAGNHEQAIEAALSVRDRLRPDRLPRILVEEMLSRNEG